LGLYVASSGDVCFYAADLTHPQTPFTNCVSQPDGGSAPSSNYFAYGANGGYFTGPMTEVADSSASSCPSLSSMPIVNYQFVAGAYIVHFTPWSDEWYPPTNADCYSSIGSGDWTMTPGSAAAQYVDASDASEYGPHWEAAQNISSNSSSAWWQFTTDATLLTPIPTPGGLDAGQSGSVRVYVPALIEHLDTNAIYEDWEYSPPASWSCTPTGDSDDTLSCDVTDAGSGTVSFQLVIGETGGYSLVSPTLDFVVSTDPFIESAQATPAASDLGQKMILDVTAAGGSGGFSYAWNNLPEGCASSSTDSLACTPASTGNFSVTVTATDSNGDAVTSEAINFTVGPDPIVSMPSGSPASGDIDAGQTVTFSAVSSSGAGHNSYYWTGLPTGCASSNSSELDCTPTASGSFEVSVSVTDANHDTVQSADLTYVVDGQPSVVIRPSSSSADVDQQFSLDASATGGSGVFQYSWTGLPAGCAGSTLLVTCLPSAPGSSTVLLSAKDSNGASANATFVFVVYADPVISSFQVTPGNPLAGHTTALSVTVAGGAPAISYVYGGLPSGCISQDTATLNCTPNSPGTYKVSLTVTDGNGLENQSSITLVVAPAFLGLPAVEGYAILFGGLALVIVAVGIALGVLARRRRDDGNPSIALRVAEYHAGPRGSPVSDITVPNSEIWSNRAEIAKVPPGAQAGQVGTTDTDEPRAPGYWDAPLISPPEPRCWNCKFENPPASRYCGKCGLPLEAPPT
jgi:hypothetical protein